MLTLVCSPAQAQQNCPDPAEPIRLKDLKDLLVEDECWVTVQGVVTDATDLINDKGAADLYIQDENGAVQVFFWWKCPKWAPGCDFKVPRDYFPAFEEGDEVEVFGLVSANKGRVQILLLGQYGSFDLLHPGIGVPRPRVVSAMDFQPLSAKAERLESFYVRLPRVTFTQSGTFAGVTNYEVVDNEGLSVVVRVSTIYQDLVGEAIPTGPVDLIGIFGQYDPEEPPGGEPAEGYQLLLLDKDRIVPSPYCE